MNAESKKMLNELAENVLTVSMEAVRFNDENEPYVLIRDDKGIPTERKKIEVGINDGLFVEIIHGISTDDTVMVPKKNSRQWG